MTQNKSFVVFLKENVESMLNLCQISKMNNWAFYDLNVK